MTELYPTSQWTHVREIQAAGPDDRKVLIGHFIERYLPAIRADVERYMQYAQLDDVDDALHDFVAEKIYTGRVIDHADKKKGKLSRYIQTCVHHFVHTHTAPKKRKITAQTIEDLPESLGDRLASTDFGSERIEYEWVEQALRSAIRKTRRDFIEKNKQVVWHVLEARLLSEEDEVEPFKIIANRLGMSQKETANLLITAKRSLRRNILSAIEERVPNSLDLEAEVFEACNHVFRQRLSFGLESEH